MYTMLTGYVDFLQDKAGRAYDSAQQGAKQAGDYTQVRTADRCLQFQVMFLRLLCCGARILLLRALA